MAIKIDGQKNTIKAESGTYVKVSNSLFVNDNPVDENGGLGEKTYHITRNGWYPVSEYSTCDVVKIDVTNYDYYAGYGAPDGIYEECKLNGSNYTVDDSFLSKKGINVIVPSPAPDPKPELKEIVEVIEYLGTNNSETDHMITTTNTITLIDKIELKNNIDLVSYDVKVEITPKEKIGLWSYTRQDIETYWIKNSIAEREMLEPKNLELETIWSVSAVPCTLSKFGDYNIVAKNTLPPHEIKDLTKFRMIVYCFLNDKKHLTLKVQLQELESHPYASIIRYYFYPMDIKITQTPKTLNSNSSTLSLRSTPATNNELVSYENLLISNDALVEGNLSVEGYINDIQWMWDEVAFTNPIIDLQNGFFARLNNCSFTTTNDVVQIPSLQLSPGGEYKHSNYKITWSGDGLFTIQSDQEITNCTGLINILRYK